MTSGSTREFLALCAIHQHFGRPGTPTDQAWTRVAVRPCQGRMAPPDQDPRPGNPPRRAPSSASATTVSGCTLASATSPPTTNTKAAAQPSARPAKPASSRPGGSGSPTIAPTRPPTRPSTPPTTCPRSPAMLANRSGICIANSETRRLTASWVWGRGLIERSSHVAGSTGGAAEGRTGPGPRLTGAGVRRPSISSVVVCGMCGLVSCSLRSGDAAAGGARACPSSTPSGWRRPSARGCIP